MISAIREYLKTILLPRSFLIIFYNKAKFIFATRLLIYFLVNSIKKYVIKER